MRILRKFVALFLYAAVLLPTTDFKFSAWMRAVEVTSTAFDSTMRRRRSKVENERFSRHLRLLQMDAQHEEKTLRVRCV
jgi:hypothetical protein